MKINKQSWHYQWTMSKDTDPPKSLCTYCCRVFAVLSLFAALGAFVLVAVLSVLLGFYELIVGPKLDTQTASAGVLVLSVACWLVKTAWAWITSRKRSLFVEWLVAMKQRICPLVEFVDEEKP